MGVTKYLLTGMILQVGWGGGGEFCLGLLFFFCDDLGETFFWKHTVGKNLFPLVEDG